MYIELEVDSVRFASRLGFVLLIVILQWMRLTPTIRFQPKSKAFLEPGADLQRHARYFYTTSAKKGLPSVSGCSSWPEPPPPEQGWFQQLSEHEALLLSEPEHPLLLQQAPSKNRAGVGKYSWDAHGIRGLDGEQRHGEITGTRAFVLWENAGCDLKLMVYIKLQRSNLFNQSKKKKRKKKLSLLTIPVKKKNEKILQKSVFSCGKLWFWQNWKICSIPAHEQCLAPWLIYLNRIRLCSDFETTQW